MDSEKTKTDSPLPFSSFPPGMSPDGQAELNKANWTLGLGIASFFCNCFTFIPALIIGVPLMKRAQNPKAKSRAKLGVLFASIVVTLHFLLSLIWSIFVYTTFNETTYLKSLDQEMRRMEQQLRESADSPADADDE